jgi:hypothetical protein
MASGGIAERSAKAMQLIEKINEERDDQKSSRSKEAPPDGPIGRARPA